MTAVRQLTASGMHVQLVADPNRIGPQVPSISNSPGMTFAMSATIIDKGLKNSKQQRQGRCGDWLEFKFLQVLSCPYSGAMLYMY